MIFIVVSRILLPGHDAMHEDMMHDVPETELNTIIKNYIQNRSFIPLTGTFV
jgi:hypothetical protein